jgi:hypothetical protein
VTAVLNQSVSISFGEPRLAWQFMSARTVRCPDCAHRFAAAYEHGDPAGLLDVDGARDRLLDHARSSARPHPTLLPAAPAQRAS